jgi:DNA-directed RNA polymerase subunit RPC12/RpoP
MSTPNSKSGSTSGGRERISCPGCGRHDHVLWPQDQDTYPWKCFNCEKSFELHRSGKH